MNERPNEKSVFKSSSRKRKINHTKNFDDSMIESFLDSIPNRFDGEKVEKEKVESEKNEKFEDENKDEIEIPTVEIQYGITEEKESSECTHEISESNECVKCGLIITEISSGQEWRYYGHNDNRFSIDPSRVQIRKNEEKHIYKDLEKYKFPQKIKELTNNLYMAITNGEILRGNCRLGLIFACVSESYKKMGIPKTSEEIGEQITISKSNILKGYKKLKIQSSKIKSNLPSIKPVIIGEPKILSGMEGIFKNPEVKLNKIYISPLNFVEEIMKKLDSNKKHIIEVSELYNKIKDRSSILNSSKPKSVACGLIFYYLKNMGKQITPSEFSQSISSNGVTPLSEITINKMYEEIKKIMEKLN